MLDELTAILERTRLYRVTTGGVDAARFLYASTETRVVEASEDEGSLWLEFWGNSDETSDVPPLKEVRCKSVEDAATEIEAWFACEAS